MESLSSLDISYDFSFIYIYFLQILNKRNLCIFLFGNIFNNIHNQTIAFVYTPLLELFPVYNELNNRDLHKTKISVYIATFICFIIYLIVSVLVVITFGTETQSNSLYNIPNDNYWITFCCFVLVIVIVLLYPVINYPMLNAIETIMDLFNCCTFKQNQNQIQNENQIDITQTSLLYTTIKPSIWYRYAIYHRRDLLSILSIFVVIAIDIGVSDLDDLFGLCGSLGLSFVCYIFPCMIWITFKWKSNQFKFISLQSLSTLFVLLFSIAVMIYSTVVIIINIIQ